jgi:hypothetical protein
MLALILSAWLLWVALQVLLLLVGPLFAPMLGLGACTNGIWITIPGHVREILTPEELEAVIAHERGHRYRLHALENLVLACFFIRRSPARAWEQELQADEYAADMGHAKALASALRKLSCNSQDLLRARMLLERTL